MNMVLYPLKSWPQGVPPTSTLQRYNKTYPRDPTWYRTATLNRVRSHLQKGVITLKDINDEALAKGMHTIEKLYLASVKRHVFTQAEATAGLEHIYATKDYPDMSHCDMVSAAELEKLEL